MYIGDYLGRREIYSPDTLAIIDVGKTPELRLTYKGWNRRVIRLANWLKSEVGVGYGDRVAILARDGIEHTTCSTPAVNSAPSTPPLTGGCIGASWST